VDAAHHAVHLIIGEGGVLPSAMANHGPSFEEIDHDFS
jgi:hypothetical protein